MINEGEAEAVRLIFQMYANEYGYNSIIDKLNDLGYKTKANKPFGKNSLYSILNNERYSSVFIYSQITHDDGQMTSKPDFYEKTNASKPA